VQSLTDDLLILPYQPLGLASWETMVA
jgi:hypothetical protein